MSEAGGWVGGWVADADLPQTERRESHLFTVALLHTAAPWGRQLRRGEGGCPQMPPRNGCIFQKLP